MKLKSVLLAAATVVGVVGAASAVTYNDTVGDVVVPGSPFPHIDIVNATFTNDANNLYISVNLNGDITATNWGKYMVAIDSVPGGDPVGNGWARPISQPSGMDYWLGSWVDFGGGLEVRSYTGSWNLVAASYNAIPPLSGPTMVGNTETMTVPLSYLGLSGGGIIFFDVFTSGGGGGDSAVDSLANPGPSIANWGDPYSTGSTFLTYDVVVPEPMSAGLIALGGLGMLRRRK